MPIRITALVAVVLSSIFGQGESPRVEVRYVANSGMLVTVSDRRFLIDAPIREGIAPYATSSAQERQQLESASPPYADVDLLCPAWLRQDGACLRRRQIWCGLAQPLDDFNGRDEQRARIA